MRGGLFVRSWRRHVVTPTISTAFGGSAPASRRSEWKAVLSVAPVRDLPARWAESLAGGAAGLGPAALAPRGPRQVAAGRKRPRARSPWRPRRARTSRGRAKEARPFRQR